MIGKAVFAYQVAVTEADPRKKASLFACVEQLISTAESESPDSAAVQQLAATGTYAGIDRAIVTGFLEAARSLGPVEADPALCPPAAAGTADAESRSIVAEAPAPPQDSGNEEVATATQLTIPFKTFKKGADTQSPKKPSQAAGAPRKLKRDSLVDLAESATVFIDTLSNGATGTGFFIASNLIMTNAHVVQQQRGKGFVQRVLISNNKIGQHQGIVVSSASDPIKVKNDYLIVGLDAAIIKVEGFESEKHFTFSSVQRPGDDVTAAGYPGTNFGLDANSTAYVYSRTVAPTLNFSFGRIQAVQRHPNNNIELLQHGAQTTGGSSGSPLLDDCGRVLGIHYSGVLDQRGAKYNYAYSGSELIKYLKFTNVPHLASDVACED